MKILITILLSLMTVFSYAQNGGACIYMLPDSTIQCYVTGNSGLPQQNACMSNAIAAGAIPIDCINTPFTSCATFYATNGVACFFGGTGSCGGGSPCDLLSLPVELYLFEGVAQGGVVVLNWSTASELNNDYFTLEHSLDGFDWSVLGVVNGAGTTQDMQNYTYEHRPYNNSLNYYRLKQTDYDGKYEIFRTISVNTEIKENLFLIKRINTFGQEVGEDYKGLIIEIYSDGSCRKIYKT